jgi:hypothetical protein
LSNKAVIVIALAGIAGIIFLAATGRLIPVAQAIRGVSSSKTAKGKSASQKKTLLSGGPSPAQKGSGFDA